MKRSRSSGFYDADFSDLPGHDLGASSSSVVRKSREPGVDEKTCPHCLQRFSEKRHVNRHITTVHEKSRAFNCDRCDFSCSRKDNLQKHISETHKKPRYSCGLCNFSTARRSTLVDHVSRIHEHPFKCRQCGQVYERDIELQAHIRSKHVVLCPYICQECGSRYSNKSALVKHQRDTKQCKSRKRFESHFFFP